MTRYRWTPERGAFNPKHGEMKRLREQWPARPPEMRESLFWKIMEDENVNPLFAEHPGFFLDRLQALDVVHPALVRLNSALFLAYARLLFSETAYTALDPRQRGLLDSLDPSGSFYDTSLKI